MKNKTNEITIELPEEAMLELDNIAERQGKSRKQLVLEIVLRWLGIFIEEEKE